MNSVVAIHTNSTTYGYNERMVESFGGYETACKGKRKYESEADARIAAKELRKRVGAKVKPYLCKHCGKYHNGHLRRAIFKDIRQQLHCESIEKY